MLKILKIFVIFTIFYFLSATISYGVTDDIDGDLVVDKNDKCREIKGESINNGCPILEETCLKDSEIDICKLGFICGEKGFCEVEKPKDLAGSCIYPKNGSSIFGNVICDSCPCDYTINFLAVLRKCDVIIPAIVSPDKKEMYGKGKPYQIPYKK